MRQILIPFPAHSAGFFNAPHSTTPLYHQRPGWSAYRLAKEAGLHPKTVKDFIVGRHDTLTANADKMLAALNNSTR